MIDRSIPKMLNIEDKLYKKKLANGVIYLFHREAKLQRHR